jgi:Fe2+ or Zn2+ uptake regulation protein
MSRYKYHNLIKELVGEGHESADSIYDMIKRRGHKVSMATIYRTLEYIVSIKEFTTFSLDGAKLYYEKNKGFHAHLVDKEKEVVLDVSLDKEKFQFPAWFRPDNSVVNFFGSREGDVPPAWINLLQVISIDDTHWQEKLDQVPPTKNADTSVDIISAKKIFREF